MTVDLVATARTRRLVSQQTWCAWWPWLNRGALATIDQGLVSGSNFILALMLARWLAVADYGGYALAFSMLMLINTVYQALLLEPMSVIGAARYRDCQREYVGVLLRINTVFAVAAGLLLTGLALCARLMHASGGLPGALGALAISIPGTLVFWLVRSGCYLELAPAPAAVASLGYSVLVLGGAWIMHQLGWISTVSVLLWAGAAAWIGAVILLPRFKPSLLTENRQPNLREVWREHWQYGRWSLASTPVMWIPENISYAFATMSPGIAQAGVLRAMMNFVVPVTQLASSLARLLNPYLASRAGKYGRPGTRTAVAKIELLYVTIGISYAGVLMVFHKTAFHVLYGHRFTESADLVAWMGIVSVSYLLLYAPMTGLRSIQSPSSVFVAYSGATIAALGGGFVLTSKFGLRGTIINLCVANLSAWAIAAWLFNKRTRR